MVAHICRLSHRTATKIVRYWKDFHYCNLQSRERVRFAIALHHLRTALEIDFYSRLRDQQRKRHMKKLGLFLAIFGFLFSILTLIGFNSILVTWIDLWGESFGWAIRGASILVGTLLYTFSLYQQSNIVTDTEET